MLPSAIHWASSDDEVNVAISNFSPSGILQYTSCSSGAMRSPGYTAHPGIWRASPAADSGPVVADGPTVAAGGAMLLLQPARNTADRMAAGKRNLMPS